MHFRVSLLLVCFVASSWPVRSEDSIRLYRDRYGVPHVFADSFAGAYFGAGYEMAEDLGWHASELAISVEGRKAELLEPNGANVYSDVEAKQFHFYEDAKTAFPSLSSKVQTALRAYAAGIERCYLDREEPRPEWAIEVEPEHLAATILAANLYQSAFEADDHELKETGVHFNYAYMGSNAFAIGPSRTEDGSTIHFGGPQRPFGDCQPECHLEWPGGRVAGHGYGLHVDPGLGLNHAWGATANWPDTSDVFKFELEDLPNPTRYRDVRANGGQSGWSAMTPVIIEIKRKGLPPLVERRWETGLGPVIRVESKDDPRWIYVWRASGWRRTQIIEETFNRQWAASVREAIDGTKPPERVSGNLVFADRSGDIAFLYNARVFHRHTPGPKRRVLFGGMRSNHWGDWAFGLGGSSPLPMVLNPACGFIASNNEAPWLAVTSGEIAGRGNWPETLIPVDGPGSGATVRGRRAREVLGGSEKISLEDALDLPFDTALPKVEGLIEAYRQAWDRARQKPQLSPAAAQVHKILGAWRGSAEADAPGMTAAFFFAREMPLFADSFHAEAAEEAPDPFALDVKKYAMTLEKVSRTLKNNYGKLIVPWGTIHGFNESGAFLPASGGTEFLVAIFQAHGGLSGKRKDAMDPKGRIVCSSGSSHMAVTIFNGNETERYSISSGGQINPKVHPNNPHARDQRPLFVSGRFKRFWLTEDEIKANLTPHEGQPVYSFKAFRTLKLPADLEQITVEPQ